MPWSDSGCKGATSGRVYGRPEGGAVAACSAVRRDRGGRGRPVPADAGPDIEPRGDQGGDSELRATAGGDRQNGAALSTGGAPDGARLLGGLGRELHADHPDLPRPYPEGEQGVR